MAIDLKRVQSVFQAAADLPPAERVAVLELECGGDAELRRRVEALLHAHDDPGELPTTKPARTCAYLPPVEPGQVFAGRYKLREKLGEGGMGVVFLADQTEPVQRLVALKIIRAGLDTQRLLARFEQERQALALMDHPNIAKIFDAGVAGDTSSVGTPYFAMELVKGLPLTRYCDEARLSPRQRIELFIPVCQAVQHAHQKGIIHRDLKPSNILVGLYDGRPVPKVIDFGVAKATGPRLTEQSIYTEVGSIIGTLEYMSPEQAELNNLDIDTRSDIYALGVILYELLTGAVPFSRKELERAGLAEMLRTIKEVEPAKPSTRLSHSGTLPSIAARRQTEPKKLTALVRGELDWIVMKALEKDRGRRYETANGLAMDVQRYLAGEPVLAAPPSASYRLRKFVRRNRGPVLAAGLVALALVGGIAGTTWGLVRAEQQRELAEAKQQEAEEERDAKDKALAAETMAHEAEKAAREQAQKRLVQIEKGNEIITSIFTDLDIRAVKAGREPLEAVLAKRLVQAAGQLEGEAVGDPLMVAGLQDRLGQSLLSLGHPQAAIPLFQKARETRTARLGADHPDTLASMGNLALGYRAAGKLDLALPLYEETLKLRKARLGADHPDTLRNMNNLGAAYRAAGKLALAVPLHEETLELMKSKLGADHIDTLESMNNLALAYRAAGKLALALPLYEETLKLRKARLGADHMDTLVSMNNLGAAYQADGKLALALPLYEETLKLKKAKLGPDHTDTLVSMNNLALGYRAAGKLDLALPLLEETLRLMKARLGADHPNTLAIMNNLATGYHDAGKLDLALPLLEETLKIRKAKLGADHPDTLLSMNNLALGYQDDGKLDLALRLFQEAALGTEKRRFQHQFADRIVNNLSDCYERLKQLDQAESLRRKWLAVVKERSGAESLPYAGELAALGLNLLKQQKWTEAEAVLREGLAIREKKQPDVWSTFNTQSLLGGALLGQKQYAEAEPLLLKGYQGMKARAKAIPPQGASRIPEALDRLIALYTAMNKSDEAKNWQAERAKYLQAKSKTPEKQ